MCNAETCLRLRSTVYTMTEPAALDASTQALIAAVSKPRLSPFIAVADGNIREALRLYQWNIELSGAVYESLHIFEVFLRNAVDNQLQVWNAQQVDRISGQPHSCDWLLDPSRLLRRLIGSNIDRAIEQTHTALRGKTARELTHADVVAQLSFGTWRYLLPDRDPGRRRLWADALQAAFPYLDAPTTELVARVDRIYRLRNRVAHLEPLLRSTTVRQDFNAMRWVLAAMNPELESWFTSRQRITTVLRRRQI